MTYLKQITAATEFISSRSRYKPKVGLILGSGLGVMADRIEASEHYAYADIPHFPVSTVEGHVGQLVLGMLEGKTVIAMQGRLHFYEGYSMQEITFPIRVMKELGVEVLIVTSACGGLNPELHAGALMFVEDHINLMGSNPLIGPNYEELGVRFPDMSEAYDQELIQLGRKASEALGLTTFSGIHAAISGPYFMSKAELHMVRQVGADTIGMSMIPEIIVAVHAKIRAMGIACVTDMAVPGEPTEILTHDKVMETANRTRPQFIRLVSRIVKDLEL